METESQPELQREANANCTQEGASPSSLGWPFGLPTCVAIHTPSPRDQRSALAQTSPALAFHQQFMNLQTTFLLPFFSDAGESSSSDSDSRSEAASSFFKDSRRITLGSLIGLPMDHSFHHPVDGAHYHSFPTTGAPRRTLQLPSCGILELLRCVRSYSESSSLHELGFTDQDGEIAPVIATTSGSLATYLHLEAGDTNIPRSSDDDDDVACVSILDVLSNGTHSPDWNDQFVSCHSVLSDAGHHHAASPNASSTPGKPKASQKSQKMQRSVSMKSFFSSICCRIDAVQRP